MSTAWSTRQGGPAAGDTRADPPCLDLPGTSWGVDPRANVVAVQADSSVSRAQMRRVRAVAARFADRVTVSRTPGVLSTPALGGGQAIWSSAGRCSVGFSVRSGSSYYYLTAGHCTDLSSTWYEDSPRTVLAGTNARSSFPETTTGS